MENINTPVSRAFKDPQRYCTACKYPLPPKALFCPGCEPPGLPDDEPEEGLSIGQTVLRMALIALLFSIVVVYKFDVNLSSYLPGFWSPTNPLVEKPAEDAKITYMVSVPQANVRESGAIESKIVFILYRGASVVILQKGDQWSLIQFGDKVGWVSSKLLIAKVE